MPRKFSTEGDILSVKRGDLILKSERFKLFTGPLVGNTPQKGIHWLGDPPDFHYVIIQCSLGSGYSDRWIDQEAGIFLYYLMISNRGSPDAKINYNSSENRALLQQREHKSPVLLMIDQSSGESEIQGRFQVLTHCHDNPEHPGVDSVLLSRVSD